MIVQRAPDQVTSWSFAFFERGLFRGERFVPGRFKHVLAFGYSDPCRTWVVLNVTFSRLEVFVLPDGPWGMAALAQWVESAAVVLNVGNLSRKHIPRNIPGAGFLHPLTCVSTLAHLVGVGGAVTPTGLWRSCLRNGATIVKDGQEQFAGAIRPAAAA